MKVTLPDDVKRGLAPATGISTSKPKESRRESPSGYHYYALFKECPRKWYIKYVLGLAPIFTAPPLIFGGAIHEAVAKYYQEDFNIDSIIDAFTAELTARKDEYESQAKFLEDYERGQVMLDTWVSTWRDVDRQMYDILEVEKQYTIKIGPEGGEFDFTIRPDRVVRRRDDNVILLPDVKTTGWSVDKTMAGARRDDQLTSYVWGYNKTHEEKAEAAMVDVMYTRGKVSDAQRSEDIFITSFAQKQFEMGLYGLISDITAKVMALSEYPWPLLFPRNARVCDRFGCEHESICRENIKPGEVPEGYRKDPWVEVEPWLKKAQDFDIGRFKL